VLQRVVGEMLFAFGEHDAVDLRLGARANQHHVLVHLGQSAAQRADGPLQRRTAADQRLLMGEVPHARAPVLQVDVAQPGAGPQANLDGPAVQSGRRGVQAGRLRQHRGLGPLVEHDQGMAEIDPAGRKRREHVQRAVDHDPFRHVEHHRARPAGGVQCRELVGVKIHRGEKVRPQQIAMLGHQFVKAAKQHAALRQDRINAAVIRAAIQRGHAARQVHAFAQLSPLPLGEG
jgi:hypothetical protein